MDISNLHIILQAVQDAEDHLELCKIHAQEAKDKLTMVYNDSVNCVQLAA